METGPVRHLGARAMLSGPWPMGNRMRVIHSTQRTELSPVLVLNADRSRTLAGHGSNGDCNNQRLDRPYGAHGEPAAENDKLRAPELCATV